jgi:hypothetical protein
VALDKEMEIAIQEATQELGLKEATARRLLKWLKDMSERELSAIEEQQHLDTLKSSVTASAGE